MGGLGCLSLRKDSVSQEVFILFVHSFNIYCIFQELGIQRWVKSWVSAHKEFRAEMGREKSPVWEGRMWGEQRVRTQKSAWHSRAGDATWPDVWHLRGPHCYVGECTGFLWQIATHWHLKTIHLFSHTSAVWGLQSRCQQSGFPLGAWEGDSAPRFSPRFR